MKNTSLFILLLITFFYCCKKETFSDMNGASISFSMDTIIFDTTFHSIGTPYKILKVYNQNEFDIVTDVTLQGINEASFRINVDGSPTNFISKLEISSNDSAFIFLEVTPNLNYTNDFLLTTKLVFKTGNRDQEVNLVCPGRNANFHVLHDNLFFNGTDTVNVKYYSISTNTLWGNDLPHVVYGDVVIEPGVTLTIEEGSEIFMHNNSSIYVGNPLLVSSDNIPINNGKLIINGSINNKVIFRGDRLDERYSDIPGQWGSIYFTPGTMDNVIDYAIIKNGTTGIRADSLMANNNVVTINNSIIKNMSSIGILAQGSKIRVNNTLVVNCGQYTIACNIGGDYEFKHCTFSNHWLWGSRNTPSILLNNYYEDINGQIRVRNLDNAYFGNCIIDGGLSTEISFQENEAGSFDFTFDHCLLKIDPSVNTENTNFKNIIKNENPSFVDYIEGDYSLDSTSIAINAGDPIITNSDLVLINDILGNIRDNLPDLGCYED